MQANNPNNFFMQGWDYFQNPNQFLNQNNPLGLHQPQQANPQQANLVQRVAFPKPKKINCKEALNNFEKSGSSKEISLAWLISEISTIEFKFSLSHYTTKAPPLSISFNKYHGFCQTPIVGNEVTRFLEAACNPKCASIINSVSEFFDESHTTQRCRTDFYHDLGQKILMFGIDQNPDFERLLEQFDSKMKNLSASCPEFLLPQSVRHALFANLDTLQPVSFETSALKIIMSPIWSQCNLHMETYKDTSKLSIENFSKLKLFWGLKQFPDFYKAILKKFFMINCMMYKDVTNLIQVKFMAVAFKAPMEDELKTQEIINPKKRKTEAVQSQPQPQPPKKKRKTNQPNG